MAKNLSQLGPDLTAFAKDTRVIGGEFVRHAALNIGDTVAESTPVDVGVARSNWIMSVGAGVLGFLFAAYYPGRRLGRGETANLTAVRRQHIEASNGFDPSKDTTIYLTNATPYLAELNDGSSRQSPPRFIEASLMSGDRALAEVRVR